MKKSELKNLIKECIQELNEGHVTNAIVDQTNKAWLFNIKDKNTARRVCVGTKWPISTTKTDITDKYLQAGYKLMVLVEKDKKTEFPIRNVKPDTILGPDGVPKEKTKGSGLGTANWDKAKKWLITIDPDGKPTMIDAAAVRVNNQDEIIKQLGFTMDRIIKASSSDSLEELKQWSNSYRYKDVVKALRKLGWNFQRQEGSHTTFYNPDAKEPPFKKSITIVNKRGTDEMDRGAIVAIQKETGLDPTRI